MTSVFDRRPILVALAGPQQGREDDLLRRTPGPGRPPPGECRQLARELEVSPYEAADVATQLREAVVEQRESFVFETVFSDPMGDKRALLRRAAESGYTVVLCFIGLASPELSEERVAIRVLQGGHDVPPEKLAARFGRTLENLRHAIGELPHVLVFDNSDLAHPFRKVSEFEGGKAVELSSPLPRWVPWRRPKAKRGR